MDDPRHLKFLKNGVKDFNDWRKHNPFIEPDLIRANLYERDLSGIQFREAHLNHAILRKAKLRMADLKWAYLDDADLYKADLSRANLRGAYLIRAHLCEANLTEADLGKAKLGRADLSGANLSGADLSEADLSEANLNYSDLTNAILTKADLRCASFVKTRLNGTNISNSQVYGISAWDLDLDNTAQKGLIITQPGFPLVTVDDIEVAQFIYFMLNNKKIRRVINALTSKAVLILGRFSRKRKEILDALRDKLSEMDYLPIIFDFKEPTDRDFTETVLTLACLSKFVIVDLTDPSSTPHESKTTIPDLEIPFLPIIQEGHRVYAMFRNFEKYPWVLDGKTYKNKNDLIQNIEKLTKAAEAKCLQIRAHKDNASSRFTPISD